MKPLSFLIGLAACAACAAFTATKAEASNHISASKLNYEIYKQFEMGADGLAGDLQMPSKRLAIPYQFNFCDAWKDGYCDGRDPWELQHSLQFNVTRYDPEDHPEGWTESMTLDNVYIVNQVDANGSRHGEVNWRPINHWHPDQFLPGRMGGTITYKDEYDESDAPCDYEEQICRRGSGKLCEIRLRPGQLHYWVEYERAYFLVDFFQQGAGDREEVVAHMDFRMERRLRGESSACGPKP